MNKDLYIALSISMIVNFIMIAVNNYLIFAILIRFKDFMNDKKK